MSGQPSGFHPSGGRHRRRRRRDPQQQNSNFPIQNSKVPGPSTSQNRRELLEKVNRAVEKARREIISAGEGVTTWKVSQDAMLTLKVDSWTSLGFAMQEVPNLFRLMMTEGKINAFIHCFIGVRKITSLYDLEVAICENEGVEQFEELELGPLLRHPLVLHYFSVKSDVTEVCKITSEEIISFLWKFTYRSKNKEIRVEEFLDFIAKKRSVAGKEKLGIRVRSLGMHISVIRKGMFSENITLKKSVEALKSEADKKYMEHPLFWSLKKQLDDDCTSEDERIDNATSRHFNLPSQNVRSSDQVSSCPCPSEIEDMIQLGLKGEMCGHPSPSSGSSRRSRKRKGKSENLGCTTSAASKSCERCNTELDVQPVDNSSKTEDANKMIGADPAIANNTMRMFITTWKKACCEQTVSEVFEGMLQFYNKKVRGKKMRSMLSSFPFIGLLNIAVSSMKSGMWDCMSDTCQTKSQQELTQTSMEKCSEYEIIDVEPSVKDASVIAEHGVEHTHKATQTGRLGELVAFKYLTGKVGKRVVNWVNEDSETGLPYDIVLGEENSKEYIEVKATKSQRKDWFRISTREWQFAVDKGESYSIAHVVLLGNNVSRVSIFKNPVKLCQLGKLHLVDMMPKQRKDSPSSSPKRHLFLSVHLGN